MIVEFKNRELKLYSFQKVIFFGFFQHPISFVIYSLLAYCLNSFLINDSLQNYNLNINSYIRNISKRNPHWAHKEDLKNITYNTPLLYTFNPHLSHENIFSNICYVLHRICFLCHRRSLQRSKHK